MNVVLQLIPSFATVAGVLAPFWSVKAHGWPHGGVALNGAPEFAAVDTKSVSKK